MHIRFFTVRFRKEEPSVTCKMQVPMRCTSCAVTAVNCDVTLPSDELTGLISDRLTPTVLTDFWTRLIHCQTDLMC
jgi:hypothetical protein